jgi:hypothetical protein
MSGGGTNRTHITNNLQLRQQRQQASSTGSTASEGATGDHRLDGAASSATVTDSGARSGSEHPAKQVRMSVNITAHGGSPRHTNLASSSPRTGSGNGGFFAGKV